MFGCCDERDEEIDALKEQMALLRSALREEKKLTSDLIQTLSYFLNGPYIVEEDVYAKGESWASAKHTEMLNRARALCTK